MQLHRALALAALVAINLAAALRLRPRESVADSPLPCRNPVAIAWRGRTQVLCSDTARVRLSDLAARVGASGCHGQPVRAGDLVRLGRRCPAPTEPMPALTRLTLGLPIDVNRAGVEQLRVLPGIGPVLAARIVEHRRRHGPFPDVVSLQRVRGIGPRTVERLGELLSAGTYLPATSGNLQSLSK